MKRGQQSAGILAYRQRDGVLEVFLVHPGGPYWAHKDAGAWSIPKGEYSSDEDALQAARREFYEETGFSVAGRLIALTPLRQPGGKVVTAWAMQAADLDPTQLHSNCFSLEWPPHSGTRREFPEVDRAAWFPLAEAQAKLTAGQRGLLRELAAQIALTVAVD